MAVLKRKADILEAKAENGTRVCVAWSPYRDGCLVSAYLLTTDHRHFDADSGGVDRVELERPSPCMSEYLIDAWTQFKSRIADQSSELFLSLSEAFDDMEEKLQNL